MSDWSDQGFPPPDKDGYGYDVDAGLLRTRQQAAKPRQTRAYETDKRTFTLTVTFGYELLTDIENFLYEKGFNWFTIDLLSGEDSSITEPTIVRLIEFYTVTNKGDGVYQASFKVEQKIHRSYYATSVLYPLENFEYSSTSVPAPMTVHFWQQVRYLEDWSSSTVPTIVSASLDKTVFHADGLLPGPFPWDYSGHQWGRNVDTDAIDTVAPSISLVSEAFILHYMLVTDTTATSCPGLTAFSLSRTLYLIYVPQGDNIRCDKSATISPSLSSMLLEQTLFRHNFEGVEFSNTVVPVITSWSLFQSVFHNYIESFEYSGTSAPDINLMSLIPLTHWFRSSDYAATQAPSITSFALVDMRGSLKVTVLRSTGGTPVQGATVEIA